MKEFIALIAALIILIAFPIQTLFDAAFTIRETTFDTVVRSYAEKARLEGCFTSEITSDMRAELCDKIPGIAPADITIVATTSITYRGNDAGDDSLISFSVSMPERQRFVGGVVFGGIVPTNTLIHTCAGKVYSEATPE